MTDAPLNLSAKLYILLLERGLCAMCTENQLKAILDRVAATARTALGDRLRGAYL